MNGMNWTESEYEAFKLRATRKKTGVEGKKKAAPIAEYTPEVKTPPTAQKKSLVVTIKGKLPTWNRLLAAGVWERKKIRDEIHKRVFDALSQSCHIASG